MNSIKLQEASILQVPLKIYHDDFTFIVNNEEFHTSKYVADLLSPLISKLHLNDPTLSEFVINTEEEGDFQQILNLINFEQVKIEYQTISFFSSVFNQLQTDKIDIRIQEQEITMDNVFDQLKKHENHRQIYSYQFQYEVDFLSSNVYTIKENEEYKFESFQLETLISIFNNPKLKLESEDQLIRIINRLYLNNSTFSELYEYVDFANVDETTIDAFASIFDHNDLTTGTWTNLLYRLKHEININKDEFSTRTIKQPKRKPTKGNEISFNDNEFDGIFNHLRKDSNIEEEVNITRSSNGYGSPLNELVEYDTQSYGSYTKNLSNEWFCFELKKHQIIPTYYSIKTNWQGQNGIHPRSWVIEASNDNSNWDIIDEQNDCSYLNGSYFSHSFPIKNTKQTEYKFIRMKLTGPNWSYTNYFYISKFEIFGTLI